MNRFTNTAELIHEISAQDIDVDRFAQLVIADGTIRDEIIQQLITHPHIMVYYHCYYVVSQASEVRPDLFYPYWDRLVPLLSHKNSYHRDIGMTILANLTAVDREDRFARILPDYFTHLQDAKFMTAQCCVRNSLKILRSKPELRALVAARLLEVDRQCIYPEKQKALLVGDVLEVLDAVYEQVTDQEVVRRLIQANLNSVSPKTRAKAKELARKYGLSIDRSD
jgi:hypothetical protein